MILVHMKTALFKLYYYYMLLIVGIVKEVIPKAVHVTVQDYLVTMLI